MMLLILVTALIGLVIVTLELVQNVSRGVGSLVLTTLVFLQLYV